MFICFLIVILSDTSIILTFKMCIYFILYLLGTVYRWRTIKRLLAFLSIQLKMIKFIFLFLVTYSLVVDSFEIDCQVLTVLPSVSTGRKGLKYNHPQIMHATVQPCYITVVINLLDLDLKLFKQVFNLKSTWQPICMSIPLSRKDQKTSHRFCHLICSVPTFL